MPPLDLPGLESLNREVFQVEEEAPPPFAPFPHGREEEETFREGGNSFTPLPPVLKGKGYEWGNTQPLAPQH